MSNFQAPSFIRTIVSRLKNNRSRKGRSGCTAPVEGLEQRQLLTVDLTLGVLEIAPFMEASRGPGNAVSVTTSLLIQQKNLGTTSVDLRNGTPDDPSDDVQVQFFLSSDATLDGGDQLVGEFNSGSFDSTISANGAIQATFVSIATIPVGPDSNFLIGKIDATNVLAETNESNNIKAIDIRRPFVGVTGAGDTISRRNKLFKVDPAVGFVDGNSSNYKNGQLVVSIVSPQANDALQFITSGKGAERLKVAGNSLKLGKQIIGSVAGNKSKEMTIAFTADVDQVVVQRVLQGIGFKTDSDSLATREITFRLKDPDGQLSDVQSKSVNIIFG